VFKQKQTNKKLKQTKKKQNKRQSIQTKTNEQKSLQYKKLKHANPALGYLRVVNHQYLNRTADFFLSSY
jgi:transcription termination factor Rho